MDGNASGIIMVLVFLWIYIQGVIGTFQYHKFKPPSIDLTNGCSVVSRKLTQDNLDSVHS
ncbi:hypothetical protein A9Q99_21950 [Gammaproteobacteria bacterium 45_16_T64]|nr:hypothetical protein A9Q99_21950 [Gammaproteobacteria bacterium 45_16_T64]